jgi:sporulation protein YlmC with PRC-barrel domain
VRLRRLLGLPVVDADVARQAGVVSDVELDLAAGRVAVVQVRHGDGWEVWRVPAEFVYRVERGAVLVQDSVELDFRPPLAPQPGWVGSAGLAGLEVLSEAGERVGRLLDADLDPDTLCVRRYLLRQRRWLLWHRRILPADVVSASRELMIVRAR